MAENGAPDPNTPLRMHLALKMLREWGMGQNFHGGVVVTIRDWIDGGKQGPIPWPGGAIFEEWATREGLSNVDGFVGLRITMQIVCEECRERGRMRGFLVCQECWDEIGRNEPPWVSEADALRQ